MIYDIIGDIHGHAQRLLTLLNGLGYEDIDGIHVHPDRNRKAVFVGDFVDRGSEIRRTLSVVRSMVDHGHAHAVMGNHEYNAICFAEDRSRHDWMRPRNDKHLLQHIETLYQFRDYREEWHSYLKWFETLPLYSRLDGINVVHATWHTGAMEVLGPYLDDEARIRSDRRDLFLKRASRRWNGEFDAVQNLLKGVEVPLPHGEFFLDKDGNRRVDVRVRWWTSDAGTYEEAAFSGEGDLADVPLSAEHRGSIPGYDADSDPVFFGHYWLQKKRSEPQASNVCCLDYSVAKGGRLAAYTWQGERALTADNFTLV